jgi:Fic-DOC domain mobile mystery protein B
MTEFNRAHPGDTPLTDDEVQGLIPSLATQRELNEFEYRNILSARLWALNPRRLAKAEVLSASYLLSLHKRMFNATWRWAGKFRTTQKTIGVDPHRIASDLAGLLGDSHYWLEHHVHEIDECVLRFHHRLVFIHPFSNGNGRHARMTADILALKLGRPAFPWGAHTGEPRVIRNGYLDSLRRADQQDYAALFAFARSGHI